MTVVAPTSDPAYSEYQWSGSAWVLIGGSAAMRKATVTGDGATYAFTITWSSAFADTTYRVSAPGFVYSEVDSITYNYSNKTTTSIDLTVSFPFTGKGYVNAEP
jgi:hypothetical protein